MRILVFGDSIAQGLYDTHGGWVNRLWGQYNEKYYEDNLQVLTGVFNLAVSGDKTDNILRRFEHEVEARKYPGEEFVFIFAVGVNNTYKKNDEYYGTKDAFLRDMEEILKLAQKYTNKFLMVGLTAVDELKTTPVSWVDIYWTNARVWEFETELRALCKTSNVPIVKVFETFRDSEQELLADGLHPNNAGHELIASLVKPELEKLLT